MKYWKIKETTSKITLNYYIILSQNNVDYLHIVSKVLTLYSDFCSCWKKLFPLINCFPENFHVCPSDVFGINKAYKHNQIELFSTMKMLTEYLFFLLHSSFFYLCIGIEFQNHGYIYRKRYWIITKYESKFSSLIFI